MNWGLFALGCFALLLGWALRGRGAARPGDAGPGAAQGKPGEGRREPGRPAAHPGRPGEEGGRGRGLRDTAVRDNDLQVRDDDLRVQGNGLRETPLRRELVLLLAEAGLSAAEIARRLGVGRGEVELILGLAEFGADRRPGEG